MGQRIDKDPQKEKQFVPPDHRRTITAPTQGGASGETKSSGLTTGKRHAAAGVGINLTMHEAPYRVHGADMTTPNFESPLQRQLREEAETRLRIGLTPPMQVAPPSIDALKLLHDLAGSPTTASAALKLLHELQVHQVELDLLHLQHEEEQSETTEQLAHYKALYEHAPVGYFVVGLDGGHIIEGNLAGARLLGIPHDQLEDHPLSSFLVGESQDALGVLLGRAGAEAKAVSCVVEVQGGADGSQILHATATLSPGGEGALVALFACASH